MRVNQLRSMLAMILIMMPFASLTGTVVAKTPFLDPGYQTIADDPESCTSCSDVIYNQASCCDSGPCDACDASYCESVTNCCRNWDLKILPINYCGWIKRGDHCFDDFISPMLNFVFFEDPRTVTELRPVFLSHQVPGTIGNSVPAGGSIQLLAMQFRIALTERLSLIATKDGYLFDNTANSLNGLLDSGWADVSAGLKFNLLRNPGKGTIASAGFTYEIPQGSESALQSNGAGELHLFLTGGQRILNGDGHLLSAFGYRMPIDNNLQTTAIHWSNHLDVRLTERTYLFTEIAWWHWTDSAASGANLGVAGQDLFNLSVNDVTGNDLVTQNIGMRYKPQANIETGVAFEFPLTGFKDVIQNRIMFDVILRY